MSDFKITQRPSAGTLTGAEIIALIQSGVDVKDTLDNVAEFIGDGVIPYTYYAATLYQTGTGNPTPTVMYNTMSGAIVWTRNSAGTYTGTLAGAFSSSKTGYVISEFTLTASGTRRRLYPLNTDSVSLEQKNAADAGADEMLIYVEIKVYP